MSEREREDLGEVKATIRTQLQDLHRQVYHVDIRAQARTEEAYRRILLTSTVLISVALTIAVFFFSRGNRVLIADAERAVNELQLRVEQSSELIARVDTAHARIAAAEKELSLIRQLLEGAEGQLNGESKLPDQAEVMRAYISAVEQDLLELRSLVESTELEELGARFDSLESILGNSPQKALALPLLRRDLKHFTEETADDLSDLQQDMLRLESRLYAMTGTGIVLALGFLSAVFAPLAVRKLASREGSLKAKAPSQSQIGESSGREPNG